MNIIDNYETINEQVINNELRSDEMVNEFTHSTEKWLARTESEASKNQPALLLEKAYNSIDEIDTNVFLKMNESQLSLIFEKIDKVQELLDMLRGELDV